jgi:hypothetical protein
MEFHYCRQGEEDRAVSLVLSVDFVRNKNNLCHQSRKIVKFVGTGKNSEGRHNHFIKVVKRDNKSESRPTV